MRCPLPNKVPVLERFRSSEGAQWAETPSVQHWLPWDQWGSREPAPTSCPLTSAHTLWRVCTSVCVCVCVSCAACVYCMQRVVSCHTGVGNWSHCSEPLSHLQSHGTCVSAHTHAHAYNANNKMKKIKVTSNKTKIRAWIYTNVLELSQFSERICGC